MIWPYIIMGNWLIAWAISWAFLGWLWKVSKDTKLEGWLWLWGWLPIARFRLISRKSWYARAWDRWLGMAMPTGIIYRDEGAWPLDAAQTERTIIHEVLGHVVQMLALGCLFWPLYALEHLRHGYRGNWFEIRADEIMYEWIASGKPQLFDRR